MLKLDIPGFDTLSLEHLVLDYNGTMAVDGLLLPDLALRLHRLAESVAIHVLTADTFGTAAGALRGLPLELIVLPPSGQANAKAAHVEGLGSGVTAAIGNGRNDQLMLARAALSIAVLQAEGTAACTLDAADLIVTRIHDALDLLLRPQRLIASLRD